MSSSSKKGGRRGKKAAPPPSPPSSSDAESDGDDSERSYEEEARRWQRLGGREAELDDERAAGILETAKGMHVDDLSSDDEEAGNATGRVPLHWYEGYDHVGYDLGGGKVVADAPSDALAQALEAQGGGALTVYDKLNGRNVVVSARELEQIRRMKGGAFANRESEMYGDALDVVASATEAMPLSAAPEPKRRFLPSKWEAMRVAKLVQGLRDGTIVTRAENKAKREKARPDGDEAFLAFAESMWANDDDDEEEETRRRGPMHVPAPKLALPNHDESYRPPEEYLLEDDELEDHEGLVPKRHDTLRAVGAYEHAVKERFERCLDLYLCPRAMKRRLNIDPESLVPKLPDPKDLKPFPNALCRDFVGHDAPVVALACSPDGQWLAETRVLFSALVSRGGKRGIGQGARRDKTAGATSFEPARGRRSELPIGGRRFSPFAPAKIRRHISLRRRRTAPGACGCGRSTRAAASSRAATSRRAPSRPSPGTRGPSTACSCSPPATGCTSSTRRRRAAATRS